eukprot:5257932-Amphidinium_carterae.2
MKPPRHANNIVTKERSNDKRSNSKACVKNNNQQTGKQTNKQTLPWFELGPVLERRQVTWYRGVGSTVRALSAVVVSHL